MAQSSDHAYVGETKCAMCHKSEKSGKQAVIWEGTDHAKAYDTLGTPQAKAIAAKLGIDNPQTSGKCLKCHSTAYGFTETQVTQDVAVQEGVSCETCHGPGKDYMKMSVMKDKTQSIANGLVTPDEKCASNATTRNHPPAHQRLIIRRCGKK